MSQRKADTRVRRALRDNLCVACLKPLLESKVIRGCHERCYRATVRAVERGDFTEADRIQAGKLLPAKTGGGRPTNPVTVEARSGTSTTDSGQQLAKQSVVVTDYDCCVCEPQPDLDFYLAMVQSRILVICGALIDLEDLLWHFFRISDCNMSVCVEVIVETANHTGLLGDFTKSILFDEPDPKLPEQNCVRHRNVEKLFSRRRK